MFFFFFFFPDEIKTAKPSHSFNDVKWENTANKGEWSELYTLYKLLFDQNLFPINKNQQRGDCLRLPILSIFRYSEKNLGAEYRIEEGGDVQITPDGNEVVRIERNKFKAIASQLFDSIKKGANEAAFDIPSLDGFRQLTFCPKIKCYSPALPSGNRDKSDIYIVIHDAVTGQTPKLGFSIKSEVGNPPTLLNATGLTNFCYKLSHNLPESKVNEINSMCYRGKSDIQGRVRAIIREGISLDFTDIKPSKNGESVFRENLILIDSSMPEIMAHLLLLSCTEESRSLNYLTEKLTEKNPLNFPMNNNKMFYEAKVKRFISDVALGMVPSRPWSAEHQAAGILVVTETGDVDCYHVIYKASLDDYLFNDLKFESPSASRHGYGRIEYGDDGNQYFSLNLQMRFIK